MTEVKTYKVLSLPSRPTPNSIYFVKATPDSDVKGYITDIHGTPFPLKDLSGSGGIQTIANTDGTLTIVGSSTIVININPAILNLINSALQSGDNISELINDVGYITLADLPSQYTDEQAQDAVGNILTDSTTIDFGYNDLTNQITADIKADSITANELSNSINISEFINDVNYETNTLETLSSTGGTIDVGANISKNINLEVVQATELQLGGGKITTQVVIENEATTNDTDLVTAKKFWFGWTKGLTLTSFFNAVRNTVLSGLTIVYTRVTSSDTILSAFGKVQGQIDTQMSTTWLSGTFTINSGDSTKFDCNVTGVIHNPITNTNTFITKSDIAQPFTYFPPTNVTYIGIDASGSYVQQATRFTPSQRRLLIGEWGLVYTGDGVNLLAINEYNIISNNITQQVGDILDSLGVRSLNGGCQFFPSPTTDLAVRHTAGNILGRGWGAGNLLEPHKKAVTASVANDTFQVRRSNGVVTSSTTLIDPTIYEFPLGTVTTLANPNDVTVHRFTIFQSGLVRSQIGQTVYSSIDEAIARTISGSDAYTTEVNIADAGCTTMFLAIQKNCTLWSQTTRFRFFVNPQTNGTSGTQFTPTFQSVYGASTIQPQIVVDDIRGAMQTKSGRALGSSHIEEWLDSGGNVLHWIDGQGGSSFGGGVTTTVIPILSTALTAQTITGMRMYINALNPVLVVAASETVYFHVTNTGQLFELLLRGRSFGFSETPIVDGDLIEIKRPEYANKFVGDIVMHQATGAAISSFGAAAPTGVGSTTLSAANFTGTYHNSPSSTWNRRTSASAGTAGSSAEFYDNARDFCSVGTGFYASFKFAFQTTSSNSRGFVGLDDSNASVGNVNPSTIINMLGVGFDSDDANIYVMHNDGSGTATKVDTGMNVFKPSGSSAGSTLNRDFICEMWNEHESTDVFIRLESLRTNAVFFHKITSDLPAVTTGLSYRLYANNGTDATSVNMVWSNILIQRPS